MSGRPNVFLLISPHLGILDAWLPILSELKRQPNVCIAAILPTAAVREQFKAEQPLTEIADAILDVVVCREREGWRVFDSLKRAAGLTQGGQDLLTSSLSQVCAHAEVVLFDIAEDAKRYVEPVKIACARAAWYSLSQGLDLLTSQRLSVKRPHGKVVDRAHPLTVYLLADAERTHYRNVYGLDEHRLHVVGIPRHAAQWIEFITKCQRAAPPHDRYILVASRPWNNRYFPEARKRQALRDIKQLAFDSEYHIVVSLHPKERDHALFDEAFGSDTLGETWSYSKLHPLAYGKSPPLFCVSLFSSACIDMLAIGAPVIEYFDLSREEQSVFSKRRLVLCARNYEELQEHAEAILADRPSVVTSLKQEFESHYAHAPASVDMIVEDILIRLADTPQKSVQGTAGSESYLRNLRDDETERQRLKKQALARAEEAVAELKSLGFHYDLRECRKKSQRPKKQKE